MTQWALVVHNFKRQQTPYMQPPLLYDSTTSSKYPDLSLFLTAFLLYLKMFTFKCLWSCFHTIHSSHCASVLVAFQKTFAGKMVFGIRLTGAILWAIMIHFALRSTCLCTTRPRLNSVHQITPVVLLVCGRCAIREVWLFSFEQMSLAALIYYCNTSSHQGLFLPFLFRFKQREANERDSQCREDIF